MRKFSIPLAVCATAVLFACSQQASDAQDQETAEAPAQDEAALPEPGGSESLPSMMRATGDLLGGDGNTIGSVNLIEGPNGITAARALFSGAVSAGAIQSKAQVQARIRALLAKEDPKRPISDKQLTAILQDEGVAVSHRVVSNYRQDIGILAPAKRRLRA